MKAITTNAGSIKLHLNGQLIRTVPKGSFTTQIDWKRESVVISMNGTTTYYDFPLGTTIDGNDPGTLEGLADALSAFNRGGTGPNPTDGVQSVTGDLVDNTDPYNPIVETPNGSQILVSGVAVPGGGTINGVDIESLVFQYGNAINSLYLTGDTLMQIEAPIPSPTGATPFSGSLHDYLTALSGEIQGIFSILSDLEDGG